MTIDKNQLAQAKKWAADIDADRQTLSQDTIDAAAEVIRDLPDGWVDADTLRKYISDWREGIAKFPRGNYESEMLDDLEDRLPVPTPQPGEAWLVRCDHATMDTIGWKDDKGRWWVQDEDVRPTKMGRNHRVTPLRRLVPEQQPRMLTTEADYAACKRDTIVRERSADMSFEKIGTDSWSSAGIEYADVDMAGVTRTVLWEREA